MDILKTGIVVAIGAGLLTYIANWWFGRKNSSRETSIIHNIFQKEKKDEIESLTLEHNKVKTEIKKKEKLSTESKKKIKQTIDNAAKEIDKIIKENNIGKINEEIQNDYEDL